MHGILKAGERIFVAGGCDEVSIDHVGLFIRGILDLLEGGGVLAEELVELAAQNVNEVCTVGSSSILVHLQDHIGLVQTGQIDAAANRQSLLLLVLFNDAFRVGLGHAGGVLRGTGRSCRLNRTLFDLGFVVVSCSCSFGLLTFSLTHL